MITMWETGVVTKIKDKSGAEVDAVQILAKDEKKVLLSTKNFHLHIKKRHPEMSIELIKNILMSPDGIYQQGLHSKTSYYHAEVDGVFYRAVVVRFDGEIKQVITAYSFDPTVHTTKDTYCFYSKKQEYDELYGSAAIYVCTTFKQLLKFVSRYINHTANLAS